MSYTLTIDVDFRAVRDAIWRSTLPASHRLVALRMVEHLPNIKPSTASLAEHCGLSPDTVQRCISELETWGCLRVTRKHGTRSKYEFTGHWAFEVPSLDEVLDAHQPHHAAGTEAHQPHHAATSGRTMRPEPAAPCGPKQTTKQTSKAVGRKRQRDPEWKPARSPSTLKLEQGLNTEEEWQAFCDHHDKLASTFADWDAAWRTWLRNAPKFAPRFKPTQRAFREEDKGFA